MKAKNTKNMANTNIETGHGFENQGEMFPLTPKLRKIDFGYITIPERKITSYKTKETATLGGALKVGFDKWAEQLDVKVSTADLISAVLARAVRAGLNVNHVRPGDSFSIENKNFTFKTAEGKIFTIPLFDTVKSKVEISSPARRAWKGLKDEITGELDVDRGEILSDSMQYRKILSKEKNRRELWAEMAAGGAQTVEAMTQNTKSIRFMALIEKNPDFIAEGYKETPQHYMALIEYLKIRDNALVQPKKEVAPASAPATPASAPTTPASAPTPPEKSEPIAESRLDREGRMVVDGLKKLAPDFVPPVNNPSLMEAANGEWSAIYVSKDGAKRYRILFNIPATDGEKYTASIVEQAPINTPIPLKSADPAIIFDDLKKIASDPNKNFTNTEEVAKRLKEELDAQERSNKRLLLIETAIGPTTEKLHGADTPEYLVRLKDADQVRAELRQVKTGIEVVVINARRMKLPAVVFPGSLDNPQDLKNVRTFIIEQYNGKTDPLKSEQAPELTLSPAEIAKFKKQLLRNISSIEKPSFDKEADEKKLDNGMPYLEIQSTDGRYILRTFLARINGEYQSMLYTEESLEKNTPLKTFKESQLEALPQRIVYELEQMQNL